MVGCVAPTPGETRVAPMAPADTAIPGEGEQVHVWTNPDPNRCPDATLPAPGETPEGEVKKSREVVLGLRPAFHACFKQFIDRHPFFGRGSVRLAVGVDCEGKVNRVRAAVSGMDRAMAACVMRAAVATRFEPPSAGIAVVSVPATFKQ